MKRISIYFFLIVFISNLMVFRTYSQTFQLIQKTNIPTSISNNAVSQGYKNGEPFVFSFAGIDNSKIYSGISLLSYAYDVNADSWTSLPDLPDTLGKIAASASTVKNKIYIIGGYHVLANGNEISSNKVHVFDPETSTYLTNGQNIPVPVDDQVQCVWKDSLIFCITGWSNTGNVPNVQIYNPQLDTWQASTSVPNNNTYKCFGGSGTIVGDTIYYYGGASGGFNFPAVNFLRKGVIDPLNPISITWSNPINIVGYTGYRTAALSDSFGFVYFIGGSSKSYNYNGLAYSNNAGVEPNETIITLDPSSLNWQADVVQNLPMDLRGIAQFENGKCFIVGGMETGQQVSSKTWELTIENTSSISEQISDKHEIQLFPNPTRGDVHFIWPSYLPEIETITCELYSHLGQLIDVFDVTRHYPYYSFENFPSGMYIIRFLSTKHFKNMPFIIID
jgi:hypothetical protein